MKEGKKDCKSRMTRKSAMNCPLKEEEATHMMPPQDPKEDNTSRYDYMDRGNLRDPAPRQRTTGN